MTDNEEGEENTSHGNDWEVVSLTESTYAAAPGPKDMELKDDHKDNTNEEGEAKTSCELFMFGRNVFPPSQHENLPLESENSEIINENVEKNASSEFNLEEGTRSGGKDEEDWPLKGLNVSEEFPGVPIFDEKGNLLSVPGTEFEESATMQEFKPSEKEQFICRTAKFSSFHGETGLGGSTAYCENLGIPEVNEPSEQCLDTSTNISHLPKPSKVGKYHGADLPCEAWWKRRAASLYAHAKDANAFWSIFIAAAVMGLVILGQRCQQQSWEDLQLKGQSSVNSEKSSSILGPIYRLKDVIVGGHQRGSSIRGISSSDN